MASIEVGPLTNNLDDDEISIIEEALEDADIELSLDEDAESRLIEGDLDEDLFAGFYDQLDANGIACDIYLPADFEDVIEVSDFKIGSAQALLLVLDEMRDDVFSTGDDDDDGGEFSDFDDDGESFSTSTGSEGAVSDPQGDYVRYLWNTVAEAARTCISEHTGMYIRQ
jgi:hypothetical protein